MYKKHFEKMEPGVVYILFTNNELMKDKDSKRILQYVSAARTTRRVSENGNCFVARLLKCEECGAEVIGKTLSSEKCQKCQSKKSRLEYIERQKNKKELRGCAYCKYLKTTKCKDVLDCIKNNYSGFKKNINSYGARN